MPHYKKRRHSRLPSLVLVALIVVYVILCAVLPARVAAANTGSTELSLTTPASNLPWPAFGEGAFGINGTVIRTHGQQKQLPTASVAKLITALAVLHKYPLSPGQQGPTITISPADYADYTKYVSEQGSIVPVFAGEQLSELSMLEAMLIPSGNNIADALASWAYGSLPNYLSFAKGYIHQLGLNQTTIGSDASGFSPDTTSTAGDLVRLGSLVEANPVLAQINAMPSANIPNVGNETNYDNLLGSNGIIGVKTGNSNQAGGVFVGAAQTNVNGKSVTIITALMGAPDLNTALADSRPLLIALENDFAQTTVIIKGTVLGTFKDAGHAPIQAVAASNLDVYLLQGQTVKATLNLHKLTLPAPAGAEVGSVTSKSTQFSNPTSVPVIIRGDAASPSLAYRLLHPQVLI